MSELVQWMAAEGDTTDPRVNAPKSKEIGAKKLGSAVHVGSVSWMKAPRQGVARWKWNEETEDAAEPNPDLWIYRDRAVGLLRRYMSISLETGRLPSIVGREFFRAKISFYRAATFEDRVIFVRDMENCLGRLEHWDQQLIARVILQEHSHAQAAYLLHCCRKTIVRRLPEVLDILSEDFLKRGLLVAVPSKDRE